MSAYTNFLNDLTNKNNLQYPDYKNQIKWVSYFDALEKEEERNKIISKLELKLNRSFKNTKLWIKNGRACLLQGNAMQIVFIVPQTSKLMVFLLHSLPVSIMWTITSNTLIFLVLKVQA